MSYVITARGRQRLGQKIRDAREAVGLTLTDAAARAKVSPTTWRGIEKGADTSVRPLTYRGIEEVIGWGTGSIQRVLDGGEPTQAPTQPRTAEGTSDHLAIWEAKMLDEIWDPAQNWTREQRQNATQNLRIKVAELRAIEDGVRRSA